MPDFLKDYEPVEDRLRAFWKDHPEGRVMTTLIAHADGDYIVFAEVWRSAGDLPAASGLAHDSAAQLPPNMKTSALEVAETSAIGRALANLGYAAKGKRPSREEMSKASPAVSEPAAESPRSGERDVASKSEGQGVIPPPSGGTDTRLAASPAGGTSSATSGEVVADMKPGEVTSSPSPGFPIGGQEVIGPSIPMVDKPADPPRRAFPISPRDCSHTFPSGKWLPTKVIDGQARCPRCGESAVIYRESG